MAPLPGAGGRVVIGARASFPRPTARAAGNTITSGPLPPPTIPGPAPAGQVAGGEAVAPSDRLGSGGPPPRRFPVLARWQESTWRSGLQGTYFGRRHVDRHAYYDRGTQRTGVSPSVPGNPPNPHTDGPAQRALRTVNRTVTPQAGSDATRNQDDLTRPYTWLGQWDGTVIRRPGGTPGLYQPYGTRGGYPRPIVGPEPTVTGGPANGHAKGTVIKQGSPLDVGSSGQMVYSGPPHGLHSQTQVTGRAWRARVATTPQQKPPRIDRPGNSPQAGQSYSQTVLPQGAHYTGSARPARPTVTGRGWAGR